MKSGIAAALGVIVFCAWLGVVPVLFGGGMLLVSLKLHFFGTFNDWILFSSIFGSVAGGLLGYFSYRKFRDKDE